MPHTKYLHTLKFTTRSQVSYVRSFDQSIKQIMDTFHRPTTSCINC